MDAEQTWLTDEALAQAKAQQKRKLVKLVPKGTLECQTAWIPDKNADKEDDAEDYASENDDDKMSNGDGQSEVDSVEGNKDNDEEYESVTVSEALPDEQEYDQQMDMHEERTVMEKI